MNFINQIIVYQIGLINVSKIQNEVCEYLQVGGLVTRFLRLEQIANSNQFADCIFIIYCPLVLILELRNLFLMFLDFSNEKINFI